MHAIVIADSGRSAATTLAIESFRAQHPGAPVTLVVSDPLALAPSIEGATVLPARSLSIAGLRYIDVWLAGGPVFARWALVPAAVAAVGAVGPALVLPDSAWVRGALDDVVTAVAADGIGLFARKVDASGVAFGGWIPETVVVGPDSAPLLAWWAQNARDMVLSGDAAAGADPWATFVSGGAHVTVIDDPTVRLSPVSADLDAATDVRLGQFPGFDPERPWWYSTSPDTRPTVLTSDNDALRRICLDYTTALPRVEPAPGATAVVGLRPTAAFRARFADEVRAAVESGEHPANPLDPDSAAAFFDWLRDPARSTVTGISPAADIAYTGRPDVAAAFPNVRWGHRDLFLRWLWTHGLDDGLITAALLPPLAAPVPATGQETPAPDRPIFGVNLVGYHDSELGLGVAVRRVGAALDAAGVPWTKVTYDRSHSRRRASGANSSDAPYWFNLILVAPDQLQFFADDVGGEFFEDHYNIGLWYWETDVMSQHQRDAFRFVDEVWGSTRYLADVFAAHSGGKRVAHIPVPLEFPAADDPSLTTPDVRERLGLDGRFTFLFSFDFLSIVQRKNPLGLVTAYCTAFEETDGCRLILKSINGDLHVDQAEELRAAIADRHDIELWDRYLDGPDRIALVANSDCYVSLHRSEGLGLTMAEAMAAGTPVIATGYSGNLDFMPTGTALLVDFDEIEIGPDSFYPADGHWADPHLDHAVELLRKVRSDASLRDDLAAAGRTALRPFTAHRVGVTIDSHLRALWDPAAIVARRSFVPTPQR